jgi:two-component system cell cycle sensor histidine kinase/response regulator CckA
MQSGGGLLEVCLDSVELTSGHCEGNPGLAPGSYCCLTVRDTGDGIDPENLERIFEPYFTTREQTGGTGLGLSVVHGIVTSIGGAITVQSRPGDGTLFTIHVPMVNDTAKTEPPAQQELPVGKERILVVDDEIFILEIMTDMLRTLGYNVETANSGKEAWDRYNSTPDRFDAILADLTMPKMTGRQLARKIRQSDTRIPMILTTGMASEAGPQEDQEGLFAAVLPKPVKFGDLANTLRQVLDTAPKK